MILQINIVKTASEKLADKEIALELERILHQLEELNLITDTVSNRLLFL